MARVSATASAPAAPARTADLFTREVRGLTLGLVSTITLVAVESLAIGTVMPIVAEELGDLALYGWVYSAFFLGNLVGIVIAGGALDRMPLHRPFAAGLGLFALGLLAGGLAPSMPLLVLARFVQGLGGGAVGPTAYTAIGRALPEPLQPRMFAMLSTAWVVPGIIGPSLAALVGELAGWRWVFLGLLPLLLVAGGLALRALARVAGPVPGATGEGHGTRARLVRAAAAAGGAALLVAALGVSTPWVLAAGTLAGAAILLPAFRSLTPPGTLFLALGVPAAVMLRAVMTFAFFASDAYLPLLLQTWRGTPAFLTGIAFTTTTIAWTLGTWWQARHIDRLGPRRFVAAGFACIAAGTAVTLPVLIPGVPAELAVVTWVLPGLGMGLMYSAVTLVVLRGVGQAQQGSASSAIQLADILGTALGTGVAGAITAAGERVGPDGLGWALAAVFAMTLVVSLAGIAASRRVGSAVPPQDPQGAAVD
jgi:MFS family permease